MPPLVDVLVMGKSIATVAFGGNDSLSASAGEFGSQMIGIEGLVGQERAELQAIDQVVDTRDLASLTGQQLEANKVPQCVSEREHLGRQSAFRASDGLIESPPFAPLAFW